MHWIQGLGELYRKGQHSDRIEMDRHLISTQRIHAFLAYRPFSPEIKTIRHSSEEGTISTTKMSISSHHGTHIDAPRHFFPNGTAIDEMPVDTFMGLARVVAVENTSEITADELAAHDIRAGERILVKSINSTYYQKRRFAEDFVYLSDEAALFLQDCKISALGIDYLAIGSFKDRSSLLNVHRVLLGSGIWILEALDLSSVEPGKYEMMCLPININQGDAAQARAIIRPL